MKLIIAILNILLSYFRPKPVESDPVTADDTPDIPPPIIKPPKKLVIPHPEEPPDYSLTAEDVEVHIVVAEWLSVYEVPTEYWEYWKSAIDIQVYEQYPDYMIRWGVDPETPAFAWYAEQKRHMAIKPPWLNIGVIAHENAHSSFSLLSEDEQLEFETVYVSLYMAGNPWLHLMDDYTNYINFPIDNESEEKETHAEAYRFLGGQLPEELKKYYPRLF